MLGIPRSYAGNGARGRPASPCVSHHVARAAGYNPYAMKKPKDGPLTRRGFLAASSAGALQAAASSKKIRTVVFGIGHAHASAKVQTVREMEQFELVGICEPDRSQARDHDVYRGVNWLSEQDILDDPAVDLIVVESGVQENLAYARRAVEAGKWVHLDKPPGVDLAALRKLFSKAEANGKIVQMGYQWRYHPAMRAAIDASRKGWLGHIYAVRATIN